MLGKYALKIGLVNFSTQMRRRLYEVVGFDWTGFRELIVAIYLFFSLPHYNNEKRLFSHFYLGLSF